MHSIKINTDKKLILTANNLNYIQVQYNNRFFRFLIDTGASISALFLRYVESSKELINYADNITIKGIGGTTMSQGSVEIALQMNDKYFPHKFLLLDVAVDGEMHGILGSDFFEKYNAVINYEFFTFTLKFEDMTIEVPLESKLEDYIEIPARCEVIKYISVQTKEDCVVFAEEISKGVFVGSSIARSTENVIPVKFLNTRDNSVKIKNFHPKLAMLNNYQIALFTDENKISVNRVEELLKIIELKEYNREERKALEHILAKFADVFHLPGDPLTLTNVYKHSIQLEENATPAYSKPYRLPHAQKSEIQKQIKDMLKNKIIEPASSPWSSPLLIVPKKADKNGERKWRIVIDYRMLNKRIKDDKFPLPNITEILDSLAGAMYFSHLDLSQGYYQIGLDSASREYTAFTTNTGQYQLTRLPMGLKISPSVFSRAMTIAMSGLNYENCFVYLDDLIVFGENFTKHNQNLVKVLHRLRKVNLKLNPNKCKFLCKELLYLGHIISAEGVLPDPNKINIVLKYPIPKDAQAVKRFVAFANYYRCFIPHFADIVAPLNNLTRKKVPFVWSKECQTAFETLKIKLSQPPVLQYPNFDDSNRFILKTDASGIAVGAVLCNKNDRPVGYASRTLNDSEKKYCTIEKELLGIVWAVKHFRPYLYGRKFIIQTDHRPLVYLFGITNPSSRLTKFRLILEEYDFVIQYIRGKTNVTADALSRIEIELSELQEMSRKIKGTINVLTRSRAKQVQDKSQGENQDVLGTDHPGIVEILKKPSNALELKPIKKEIFLKICNKRLYFKKNNIAYDEISQILYLIWTDSWSASTLRASLKDCQKWCARNKLNELIIVKNKEAIAIIDEIIKMSDTFTKAGTKISILSNVRTINDLPTRKLILNDFHVLPTGGHAGINRMFNNVKKYYYWNGLYKDVESFVRKCDDCQRYKHSIPQKVPLTITTTASVAFQKVFLDLVGPLESDYFGNKYILTVQCDLSKFVEAYPLCDKETVTVAKSFVNNFILRYGIPSEIMTDQGKEFMSSVFRETCKILNITKLNSTAYHHESIGALENSHKHLGAYLRMQTTRYNTSWSDWLPFWCFSYNTQVHTETKYTPFELVFGRLPKLPSNIDDCMDPLYTFDNYPYELRYRLQQAAKDAKENLEKSKTKRKIKYDHDLCNSNNMYEKGDLVLVKNITTNKMDELFKGPYSVIRDEHPNICINGNGKEIVLHKNRVKRYYK